MGLAHQRECGKDFLITPKGQRKFQSKKMLNKARKYDGTVKYI